MWLIVVGALIVICIAFLSPNSEKATTADPTLSVETPPFTPFDSTNPHEIYDVVKHLSTIVANKGDSYLIVYLQDENPNKGWHRKMGLTVNIDDWHSDGLRLDSASFIKLGLPFSAAQYLASVPFAVSGDDLKYDFPIPFDYPSTYARFIVEEMENGTRSSSYVQHGLRQIKIENNYGVISCKSD